jgi:hypothetical protein
MTALGLSGAPGGTSRFIKPVVPILNIEHQDIAGTQFRGTRVGCRPRSEAAGRCASFWHLTQQAVEEDRTPDLRRCERIRWVRWVIENAPTHAEIDEWQNARGTEVNTLLWYRELAVGEIVNHGARPERTRVRIAA